MTWDLARFADAPHPCPTLPILVAFLRYAAGEGKGMI